MVSRNSNMCFVYLSMHFYVFRIPFLGRDNAPTFEHCPSEGGWHAWPSNFQIETGKVA